MGFMGHWFTRHGFSGALMNQSTSEPEPEHLSTIAPEHPCSGCKRMRVHRYVRTLAFEINRHHVEPAGVIQQMAPGEKVDGHPDDPLLLPRGDRRAAAAILVAGPGLHLDEHQGLAGARD